MLLNKIWPNDTLHHSVLQLQYPWRSHFQSRSFRQITHHAVTLTGGLLVCSQNHKFRDSNAHKLRSELLSAVPLSIILPCRLKHDVHAPSASSVCKWSSGFTRALSLFWADQQSVKGGGRRRRRARTALWRGESERVREGVAVRHCGFWFK